MKPALMPTAGVAPPGSPDPSTPAMRVLEEYLAKLERGVPPHPEELLAQHPELAEALKDYLASLEFLHGAALNLRSSERVQAGASAAGPVELGQLGDYRLLRELGRGGMGIVYEAEQLSLCRQVALKVLPFAAALDPKQLQRFKNEAQAAAQLHHTNIVPVFGVGCERGVHYYAMQYVEGQTLAKTIADLRLQSADLPKQADSRDGKPAIPATRDYQPARSVPQSEISNLQSAIPPTPPVAALSTEHSIKSAAYFRMVASLAVQAAEALEHAHQLGVVHRDIKPANLLVDMRGNLWITDFGLAHCKSQAGLTMTGDLVGTLRYMSPEQALAKRVLIDHRTDIYSLGVTLYELLTLEPAYRGNDRQELLRQIAFEEPRPLRRLNRSIPPEVETIVLKAMEKNPAERYATAQELADDLRRFLEDKPIRAKRPTLVQRARKWSRRHRAVVAATTVVLALALVLLGGAGGWLLQQRLAAEAEALEAFAEAQAFQQQARWPEARAAARRAEGLLTGGGGRAELRQRASELLDDLAMVQQLEEIRLEQSQVVDNHFDIVGADAAYAQAFRDYGLDVEALGPEAAAWIRTRSIAVELAVALDDWAMARRQGKGKTDGFWKQLLAIARAADADPFRTQLRQALETGGKAELEVLADGVMGTDVSATTLVLLGRALQDWGAPARAIALLREGQHRYPGDLWLNHDLALLLASAKAPQLQEAIRFFTAALALRPQNPGVYVNLGVTLSKQGRLDEAVVACRKAIELKRDYADAHSNLGSVLDQQGRLDEAVAACQKALALKPDYPEAYTNLGNALREQGKLVDAMHAYRKALALKPELIQAHMGLGNVLVAQRKLPEAVEAHRKTIELKPDHAEAHRDLGYALSQMGRLDEAVAACRKAIELNPDYAEAHGSLGYALTEMRRLDEAVAACRKAIELKPDYAEAHCNLGTALKEQGRLDEAVAAWRKAIELKPDFAMAHWNLGGQLAQMGRPDEAMAACRKAIELKPDCAEAYCNLGVALAVQGRLDEAVTACRKAIELKPDLANAYDILGNALRQQGRLDEAVTAFRKEIELEPDGAVGYYNLGIALEVRGRLDEAMAAYRKAIELNPDHAEAHCNLGGRLQAQGKFEQALVHRRRGHELGSRNPQWPYPSAQWVRECEALLELDRKLPAILKGEVQPADAAERLRLANICSTPARQLYAVAARFSTEAFAAQPALADDRQKAHRYNAACAAALAGCGQGKDTTDLSEQQYEELRRLALSWLHAELTAWRNLLEKEPDKTRPVLVQQMRHWLADTDFAGVRSPEGLARLPEAERRTWREFWSEVQRLIDQAGRPPPAAPPKS